MELKNEADQKKVGSVDDCVLRYGTGSTGAGKLRDLGSLGEIHHRLELRNDDFL